MYSNQFTRYDPKEFIEVDAEDFVVTKERPIMCSTVSRAALQRSVGKIFFHAGFEEFQPTAIDAVTDIAAGYMQNLAKTLGVYAEAPQHERKFTPEVHTDSWDTFWSSILIVVNRKCCCTPCTKTERTWRL